MTTLAQAVKVIVQNSIDQEFFGSLPYTIPALREVYQAEYGYNGTSPKACMDYLQGLPSVCTIPFYNAEILELLAAQGISRKTEDGQAALIEKYWQEAGYQFYMLVK
jgi:hypothetical protein